MKLRCQRSAECHSAVSPNGIRRIVATSAAQRRAVARRISTPRHSRVPLRATELLSRRAYAFTLIEMLVYMSMLFVVITLGYAAMYNSMDASTGLRRNASDITHALDAGERWREDIRTATQSPRVERVSDAETLLHIPQASAEVTYRFASNSVSRRVGSADWVPALEHVETSTFICDPRQKVTAWKWEIELQSYRKSLTRLHPLFTFLAVPTNTPAQ